MAEQASSDEDVQLAARMADYLMDMSPSEREMALWSRWWPFGVSSDPEHRRVAEAYFVAWSEVKSNDNQGHQRTVIRQAVMRDLQFQHELQEARQTTIRLEQRVENLEAMLGRVLARLPDDLHKGECDQ